jgi:hypothetical protein
VEKIQEKLKGSMEKQSMKSLERISFMLDESQQNGDTQMETDSSPLQVAVEALENATSATTTTSKDFKGENKIPIKMSSKKRKKALRKSMVVKPKEERIKARPKYFCSF